MQRSPVAGAAKRLSLWLFVVRATATDVAVLLRVHMYIMYKITLLVRVASDELLLLLEPVHASRAFARSRILLFYTVCSLAGTWCVLVEYQAEGPATAGTKNITVPRSAAEQTVHTWGNSHRARGGRISCQMFLAALLNSRLNSVVSAL